MGGFDSDSVPVNINTVKFPNSTDAFAPNLGGFGRSSRWCVHFYGFLDCLWNADPRHRLEWVESWGNGESRDGVNRP